MNLMDAKVEGNSAYVNGATIPLGHGYSGLDGKIQIGVRPEFVRLSESEGLPVKVRRVEDVGRHKIVRAEFFGADINIIAGESDPVTSGMTRVVFDPAHVNVYANSWRVTGEAA